MDVLVALQEVIHLLIVKQRGHGRAHTDVSRGIGGGRWVQRQHDGSNRPRGGRGMKAGARELAGREGGSLGQVR